MSYRSPTATKKISDSTAPDFYLECCRLGGNVPSTLTTADRRRGRLVLDWFDAMATPQERADLRSSKVNDGDKRRLVMMLDELVAARLRLAFDAAKLPVPLPLQKPKKKPLASGGIESRLSDLKSAKKTVPTADSAQFAEFRSGCEQRKRKHDDAEARPGS